ncbi:MAG: aminotransferase class I/II-fold pyridoxal phosphate-dependent enzyme [Dethiobacter sp.]|jgi:aspartate/methionine/tyrosine aminotransferase|nr:aminotransferase class I/II-fold pyridoxal phosphate-dependent enzyme [Dethiobacter sp.]
MNYREFKLERYFARYEFSVRYLLSPSDCESLSMQELLALADQECMELWHNLKLGYTESSGHPLLRDEAAAFYRELTARDMLIVNPEEGIFIAMQSLLEAGDEVIVLEPSYQSLREIPRALGCRVVSWPLTVREGRWQLDPEHLKAAFTPRTRMVIVNFPHNPTGFLPDRKAFLDLLALAEEKDVYLFSDEIYRLLEHDPSDRLPAAADCYHRAISLGGLSKSFGLPGLRLGWLATRDESARQKFVLMKDYTSICGSAPSEILGIIALRAKAQIVREKLALILENLKQARELFSRHEQMFQWLEPRGGSTAFPCLRADHAVDQFCLELVKDKNVMLLPGEVFDFPGNYFRIGLGRKNFAEGLALLEQFIQNR